MLKLIPSILSPELLAVLAEMGHGDEIVLADANFPAVSTAQRLVRADGHAVNTILEAVLKLLPLDTFVESPAVVMQIGDKPNESAPICTEFQKHLDHAEGRHVAISSIERFAFYERSKKAFAVVSTGETALYANLILKKGVIFPK